MDQRMFQQILRRYFNGTASEEEKRMVDAWYEAMGRGDPSSLSHSEEDTLKQRYWSAISGHIGKARHSDQKVVPLSRTRTRRIIRHSVSIAASLTLVVIGYVFLWNKDQPVRKNETSDRQYTASVWTQLENKDDAVKLFDLPDGSRISLEPRSRLKYGTAFNQAMREVFLEGEAHFEVAHDQHRPFLVHAREVTTTVLGTSFRVKAYEDDKVIKVAVQTGRVAVSADRSDKAASHPKADIVLTPNQQIVYNRSERTMERSIVDEPQPIPTEEKTRRTRFDEAPVAEIFRALERVYGVNIKFDKDRFSSCVLTTSISDGGIYNRLDIICEAIGADYTVDASQIVITGSGCD